MPTTKEQFRRLMELDKFFQKGRRWKASELLCKLVSEASVEISERTLKNDLAFLVTESQGILTNKKIGREWFWFYTDTSYSHFKKSLLLDEFKDLKKLISTFKQWGDLPFWEEIELMLQQFETRFTFNNHSTRKLIDFQKPVSRNGNHWLKTLYEAADKRQVVEVLYRSLRTGKALNTIVHPYLLKEYNNRWWLIGWSGKHIVNIALESIDDIEHTEVKFIENSSFDPITYFESVLGVTINQTPVELVRLKVHPQSIPYLRTKKIHHTQNEVNNDGTEMTLQLIPNSELIQAILQYGPNIEVIEPSYFRKEVGQRIREAAVLYADLDANSLKSQ